MASYLRPRRGRKQTAINQGMVLKRGEVFFEVPDSGVGTGEGAIKMGDGSSRYEDLPYFLNIDRNHLDISGYAVNFEESQLTDFTALLNSASDGTALQIITGAFKKMLRTLNTNYVKLSNDFTKFETAFRNGCSTIAGKITSLGYPIADNASPSDMAAKIEHIFNDRYNKGIAYADGRVNTNSESYKSGYNAGITYADGRVNTNSASYKSGYNAGVVAADARVNTNSANYKAGYNAGLAAGLNTGRSFNLDGKIFLSVKSMEAYAPAVSYISIPCYGAKTFSYSYNFDVNPGPVDFRITATGSSGTLSIVDTVLSETMEHKGSETINLNGNYNMINIDVRTTGSTRGRFETFRCTV